jgi:hypothetical protein
MSNGFDIRWWAGEMTEIKWMQYDKYWVAFTRDTLAIGCKQYLIDQWKTFSDEEISAMDKCALEWWKEFKDNLFQIIEKSFN